MPYFAIIGYDFANSAPQRKLTRDAHVARLKKLEKENRLLVAGPTPIEHGSEEMSGSLLIIDFDDLEVAQAWVNDEPYLNAGVYSHVDIRPFIHTLPTPQQD